MDEIPEGVRAAMAQVGCPIPAFSHAALQRRSEDHQALQQRLETLLELIEQREQALLRCDRSTATRIAIGELQLRREEIADQLRSELERAGESAHDLAVQQQLTVWEILFALGMLALMAGALVAAAVLTRTGIAGRWAQRLANSSLAAKLQEFEWLANIAGIVFRSRRLFTALLLGTATGAMGAGLFHAGLQELQTQKWLGGHRKIGEFDAKSTGWAIGEGAIEGFLSTGVAHLMLGLNPVSRTSVGKLVALTVGMMTSGSVGAAVSGLSALGQTQSFGAAGQAAGSGFVQGALFGLIPSAFPLAMPTHMPRSVEPHFADIVSTIDPEGAFGRAIATDSQDWLLQLADPPGASGADPYAGLSERDKTLHAAHQLAEFPRRARHIPPETMRNFLDEVRAEDPAAARLVDQNVRAARQQLQAEVARLGEPRLLDKLDAEPPPPNMSSLTEHERSLLESWRSSAIPEQRELVQSVFRVDNWARNGEDMLREELADPARVVTDLAQVERFWPNSAQAAVATRNHVAEFLGTTTMWFDATKGGGYWLGNQWLSYQDSGRAWQWHVGQEVITPGAGSMPSRQPSLVRFLLNERYFGAVQQLQKEHGGSPQNVERGLWDVAFAAAQQKAEALLSQPNAVSRTVLEEWDAWQYGDDGKRVSKLSHQQVDPDLCERFATFMLDRYSELGTRDGVSVLDTFLCDELRRSRVEQLALHLADMPATRTRLQGMLRLQAQPLEPGAYVRERAIPAAERGTPLIEHERQIVLHYLSQHGIPELPTQRQPPQHTNVEDQISRFVDDVQKLTGPETVTRAMEDLTSQIVGLRRQRLSLDAIESLYSRHGVQPSVDVQQAHTFLRKYGPHTTAYLNALVHYTERLTSRYGPHPDVAAEPFFIGDGDTRIPRLDHLVLSMAERVRACGDIPERDHGLVAPDLDRALTELVLRDVAQHPEVFADYLGFARMSERDSAALWKLWSLWTRVDAGESKPIGPDAIRRDLEKLTRSVQERGHAEALTAEELADLPRLWRAAEANGRSIDRCGSVEELAALLREHRSFLVESPYPEVHAPESWSQTVQRWEQGFRGLFQLTDRPNWQRSLFGWIYAPRRDVALETLYNDFMFSDPDVVNGQNANAFRELLERHLRKVLISQEEGSIDPVLERKLAGTHLELMTAAMMREDPERVFLHDQTSRTVYLNPFPPLDDSVVYLGETLSGLTVARKQLRQNFRPED